MQHSRDQPVKYIQVEKKTRILMWAMSEACSSRMVHFVCGCYFLVVQTPFYFERASQPFTPCPQNPNHQGRYPLQTGLHCKRCVSPPHFIPSPTSSKKDTREGQEIWRKEVRRCKQEEEETRACGTGKEGEIAFEFPRACNEKVVGIPCVA